MTWEAHDYVNYDPGDYQRKIRYLIKQESRGNGKVCYSLFRYNPIGQGWHVANYDAYEKASAVAAVLQSFADSEVH